VSRRHNAGASVCGENREKAGSSSRGGFEHGGWAEPYPDAVMRHSMGMANAGAMLFGRRTYIDFFNVWPKRTNNPYTCDR